MTLGRGESVGRRETREARDENENRRMGMGTGARGRDGDVHMNAGSKKGGILVAHTGTATTSGQ